MLYGNSSVADKKALQRVKRVKEFSHLPKTVGGMVILIASRCKGVYKSLCGQWNSISSRVHSHLVLNVPGIDSRSRVTLTRIKQLR